MSQVPERLRQASLGDLVEQHVETIGFLIGANVQNTGNTTRLTNDDGEVILEVTIHED